MNKLFYGDNLDIRKLFICDETVNLCYIDPTLNSRCSHNQNRLDLSCSKSYDFVSTMQLKGQY